MKKEPNQALQATPVDAFGEILNRGSGVPELGLSVFSIITSFTFWLVVLVALIAYLCVSVWLRHRALQRAEQARLRAIDREFPPRAFDASAIAPQIKRVHQDCAASAHQRWRPAYCRSELFAAARRLVASFAYFRRTRHEHELHKHDA